MAIETRELKPEPAASTVIDAYRAGEPVIATRNGRALSLVMGLVIHDDGIAWCDDGVLSDMNPGHAHHYLRGATVDHGWALECDGMRFTLVDPWHRWARRHWQEALEVVSDMAMARRSREILLGEELSAAQA